MNTAIQTELRWLDGSAAAEALNPLIEARGGMLLNGSDNPILTRARVAFDEDGDVQGYFVLQMIPFLGPMLVVHGSDPVLFRQLASDMLEFMRDSMARGWLIIAENPRIADICRDLGFRQETMPVFWGK